MVRRARLIRARRCRIVIRDGNDAADTYRMGEPEMRKEMALKYREQTRHHLLTEMFSMRDRIFDLAKTYDQESRNIIVELSCRLHNMIYTAIDETLDKLYPESVEKTEWTAKTVTDVVRTMLNEGYEYLDVANAISWYCIEYGFSIRSIWTNLDVNAVVERIEKVNTK